MSFLLVVYAFALISLTMKRYRRPFSAFLVILCIFAATTALLLYGFAVFKTQGVWHVFGKDIVRSTFIYLVAVLYVFNTISSVLIIRNYLAYRKVNR